MKVAAWLPHNNVQVSGSPRRRVEGLGTKLGLAFALLLSGCLSRAAVVTTSEDVAELDPVVIALLDTGANPYLELMEGNVGTIPGEATEIALSQAGGIRKRYDADEAMWDSMEFNRLYHFAGTRMLAISFAQLDAPINYDGGNHGAATAYLAAMNAPDAVIVAVQIDPAPCGDTRCLAHRSIAEGMEWIADQPWIDVVSISLNLPGNPPDSNAIDSEYARYVAASERAARDGKIILNSAGNYVIGPTTGYFAGPPWVIAVGGAESYSGGESLLAGKGVDIVANFTGLAPKVLSEELEWRSGTSFSTPIVAGTIANALQKIRTARPGANVTTHQLRDALNATGVYFTPTDWDPTPSNRGPLGLAPIYSASLPVLVQPQMGWGYIDGSFAEEIARRVLEDDLAPPPEKQQAILFQAQWQRAREEYWAQYAR